MTLCALLTNACVEFPDGGGVSGAEAGIGRVGANIVRNPPGARALLPRRKLWNDRHALYLIERECVRRRRSCLDRGVARDGDLGPIDALCGGGQRLVADINIGRRLQARSDALLPALHFERARDDAANGPDLLPLLAERIVPPLGRDFREA